MPFRRVAAAGVLVLATLIAGAAPAAAHGIGGAEPTNVRSRVLSITPAVAGITVRVLAHGARIELRNDAGAQVIVSGYDGEPYLRFDADGVFENTRSPATFVNRTSTPPANVPRSYDAAADPQWRKVTDGTRYAWHDHRAHAMSSGRFETSRWSIPLSVDGRPVVVAGELAWIEAGPWWPWLLLTAGIAIAVAAAGRAAWRLTATCTLAALLWSEALHVLGSWSEASPNLPGRIAAQLMSVAAVALGVCAFVRVSRASAESSAPFVLLAAVVFIVAGGVGDVTAWTRSQLPSTLPAAAVRASVALAFGGGTGLVIAAARRLAPAVTTERASVS
jgi:hypothetical protein